MSYSKSYPVNDVAGTTEFVDGSTVLSASHMNTIKTAIRADESYLSDSVDPVVENAVRTTAQTLTSVEQAQARENISAAAQDAMDVISRGHGENLIALTDFTEAYGSGTSYTVDSENQAVTVTSTSGTWRSLQTSSSWVQEHLTKGHTYRLHVKAEKVSGTPAIRVAFRGTESGVDIVPNSAAIPYPDDANGGDAFVDYTIDAYTRRITLFVTMGTSKSASVTFSNIWLTDVTDDRNLASVDTTTALFTHTDGSLLTMNGQLYKATQAIAPGDTIAAGTNVTETSVAEQLAERDAVRETDTADLVRLTLSPLTRYLFHGINRNFTVATGGNLRRATVIRNTIFSEGTNNGGSTFQAVLMTVDTPFRTYQPNNANCIFRPEWFRTIKENPGANYKMIVRVKGSVIKGDDITAYVNNTPLICVATYDPETLEVSWNEHGTSTSISGVPLFASDSNLGYGERTFAVDRCLANGNICVMIIFRRPTQTIDWTFDVDIVDTNQNPWAAQIPVEEMVASGKYVQTEDTSSETT